MEGRRRRRVAVSAECASRSVRVLGWALNGLQAQIRLGIFRRKFAHPLRKKKEICTPLNKILPLFVEKCIYIPVELSEK